MVSEMTDSPDSSTSQRTSGVEDADLEAASPTHSNDPKQELGTNKDVNSDASYSIFSRREKWFLVFLGSLSALLSPLTANIYLPALPIISQEFNKSLELINLTVTTYMIFQGISPVFWAPFGDRYGRRIVFILCMALLCLSCVGLALVPTNAYWLLLLLRCFQAAGSASTVALAAGLIVDIAPPSERGMFLGAYTLGPMVGPCLGPVIGGALSGSLGWRAIFWFICIFSGAVLLVIVLILPETLRSLVGDGSIPAPRISRPVFQFGKRSGSSNLERPPQKPLANPLRLYLNIDVLLILTFNAIVYSVFYGVTTTTSILFQQTYPYLTQTDIGLCFIAVGGGCIPGAWLTGKLLDKHYRALDEKYKAKKAHQALDNEDEKSLTPFEQKMDIDFPLERARLSMTPINLAVFLACVVGYGWSLESKVHIAVPLVLTFFIGWSFIGIMNTHQNLIMDLFPSQGSSITAANNLFRCSAGAALVAVEQLIIDALNPGWTFVLFAGICLLSYPLSYYEMMYGYKFRAARQRKAGRRS